MSELSETKTYIKRIENIINSSSYIELIKTIVIPHLTALEISLEGLTINDIRDIKPSMVFIFYKENLFEEEQGEEEGEEEEVVRVNMESYLEYLNRLIFKIESMPTYQVNNITPCSYVYTRGRYVGTNCNKVDDTILDSPYCIICSKKPCNTI